MHWSLLRRARPTSAGTGRREALPGDAQAHGPGGLAAVGLRRREGQRVGALLELLGRLARELDLQLAVPGRERREPAAADGLLALQQLRAEPGDRLPGAQLHQEALALLELARGELRRRDREVQRRGTRGRRRRGAAARRATARRATGRAAARDR